MLSFIVHPGVVTRFLGPNGAGKSTTLRLLVGLVRPLSGSATIRGRPCRDLPRPATTVGVMLDPGSVQRYRTGTDHLTWMCRAIGADPSVIPAKLAAVGLAGAADRRIGEYSLGMRQLLRNLADEGRTVLVSSHLMDEMERDCRPGHHHQPGPSD